MDTSPTLSHVHVMEIRLYQDQEIQKCKANHELDFCEMEKSSTLQSLGDAWLHDYHNTIHVMMVLNRISQHWIKRELGKGWYTWYDNYTWLSHVSFYDLDLDLDLDRYDNYTWLSHSQKIVSWVTGHWMRRHQSHAWNTWYSQYSHYRKLHPLRAERNRLVDQVHSRS